MISIFGLGEQWNTFRLLWFLFNKRENLSPFTKDFRGEEHFNESIDNFSYPSQKGDHNTKQVIFSFFALIVSLRIEQVALLYPPRVSVYIYIERERGRVGGDNNNPWTIHFTYTNLLAHNNRRTLRFTARLSPNGGNSKERHHLEEKRKNKGLFRAVNSFEILFVPLGPRKTRVVTYVGHCKTHFMVLSHADFPKRATW